MHSWARGVFLLPRIKPASANSAPMFSFLSSGDQPTGWGQPRTPGGSGALLRQQEGFNCRCGRPVQRQQPGDTRSVELDQEGPGPGRAWVYQAQDRDATEISTVIPTAPQAPPPSPAPATTARRCLPSEGSRPRIARARQVPGRRPELQYAVPGSSRIHERPG
jgi:hypothetical protein